MPLTSENEAEYQNILEALSKCVDGARVPYNDGFDHEQRKVQLDNADRSIRLLGDAFDEIMLKLTRDRNLYVPINRLVDELLIEIWTYTDLQDRFSVSRVSSRWRQVALSATSLWTLIDLEHNHVPRLRNLLQLSGSSPLHFVVGIKKYTNRRAGLFGPSSVNPRSLTVYNYRSLSPYDHSPPIMSTLGHTKSTSMRFLMQKEFDAIVTRSATLDAFVGESKRFYVTLKTLTMPMPYLKTLRLMLEEWATSPSQPFGAHQVLPIESVPVPMFGKETPNLREVYFETIHAQWGDPIYKNLTRLRLSHPKQRATVPQILRILELCPKMANLELKECLQYGSSPMASDIVDLNHIAVVHLPQMSYFHLEDSDITPIVDLLASLSLPSLIFLYLIAPGYKFLTDTYGRPLKSLLPTIGQPTDLMITGYQRNYTLQAMNRNITIFNTDIQSHVSGRWYYMCRNTMAGNPFSPYSHPPMNFGPLGGTFNPSTIYVPPTNLNPAPNISLPKWTATAIALDIQPPANAGVGVPVNNFALASGDSSNDFIDLLEHASFGGVQFHGIERLDFSDGMYFMDTIYRDVFLRCNGVQKLKFSYNKGVGILNAIIKEDLCPMLTEVYLCGIESFPGGPIPAATPLPTLLAEWVESRRATSSCRGLKKVVVQFFDIDEITLDKETRKRIEDGLGDEGTFIWRSIWSPEASSRRQWTKLVEEDNLTDQQSTGDNENEEIEDSKDRKNEEPAYPVAIEWPLSQPIPIIGRNSGPW